MYLPNVFDFLESKSRGKKVLDCGAAGEEGIGEDSPYWVHGHIKKNADYVLGFDLEKKAVEKLRKKGYNVVEGDCENLKLDDVAQEFDLAFAGEIIEHLSKPGDFLDGLKKYLKKDGEVIITTPNAFSVFRFLGNMAKVNMENPQHVLVQNEETLSQLLERHDYEVSEKHFFTSSSFYEQPRLRTLRKIGKILFIPVFWIFPQLSHQILIVAKKK